MDSSLHTMPVGFDIAFYWKEVLPDAAAVFDKSTEDGTAYRIYRFGTIEVRTMQERSLKWTLNITEH